MNERVAYIQGLHQLAYLLAEHENLSLPHQGPWHAQSVFVKASDPVTQALLFIAAMDEPPTIELNRQSKDLTWVDITGRIAGLHLALHLRAHEVCEHRPKARRAADRWVVPAELLAACAEQTPSPRRPSVGGGPDIGPDANREYREHEQADYDTEESL